MPVPAEAPLRGREAELELVDARLRRPPGVIVFHGPPGSGKSELLGQLVARADAADPLVPWAFVDLDRVGVDGRETIRALTHALRERPMRIRPVRAELLLAALGVHWDAPGTLAAGTAGLLAASTGTGSFVRIADGVIAGVRAVRQAGREARVHDWLCEQFGVRWQERLQLLSAKELEQALPAALAADLVDACKPSGPAPLLVVDSLPVGGEASVALSELAEALLRAQAEFVLVITALAPVRWRRPSRGSPSWLGGQGLWSEPGTFAIHELRELEREPALQVLDDRAVEPEIAGAVVNQLGGLPGALVIAAHVLADAPDRTAARAALTPDPHGLADGSPLRQEVRHRLLGRLVGQMGSEERAFLEAVSIPSWFTAELSNRLYDDPAHDRLLAESLDKRYVRTIEVQGMSQRCLTVDPLLRETVLDEAPRGPRFEQWQEVLNAWLTELAPVVAAAPFDIGFARVDSLRATDSSAALHLALTLIDSQVHAYRLERARSIVALMIEDQLTNAQRASLLLRQGRIEQAAGGYGAALGFYGQAEQLLDPDADRVQRLGILKHLAEAHRLAGSGIEAAARFRAFALEAENLGDEGEPLREVALLRAAWGLSVTSAQLDDLRGALGHSAEVSRRMPMLDTAAGRAAADALELYGRENAVAHLDRNRARVLRCLGDYVSARAAVESALDGYGETSPIGRLLVLLLSAKVRLEQGDLDGCRLEAAVAGTELLELGHDRAYGSAQVVLLDLALAVGDWDAAQDALRELGSRRQAFPFADVNIALARGEISRRQGLNSSAIEHYERAIEEVAPLGSRIEQAVAEVGIAEAQRALGRPELAWRYAEAAAQTSLQTGHLAVQVWAQLAAARVGVAWEQQACLDAADEAIARFVVPAGVTVPEVAMRRNVHDNSPLRLRLPQ